MCRSAREGTRFHLLRLAARSATARFNAAARREHPPQGRIPTAAVSFLTASPRPISRLSRGIGIRMGRSLFDMMVTTFGGVETSRARAKVAETAEADRRCLQY